MFGPTSSMPPAERFDGDTIDFRYEWTDYVGLDLDCPGLSDAISTAADQHKLIDATFSSWEWAAAAAEEPGDAEINLARAKLAKLGAETTLTALTTVSQPAKAKTHLDATQSKGVPNGVAFTAEKREAQ